MKLQAIKKVCKACGEYVIYDDDGGQWMGTSGAIYAVEGIRVDEKNLGVLFEMETAKLEAVAKREIFADSSLYPDNDGEMPELMELMAIRYGGVICRALAYGGRMYLIPETMLKPTKAAAGLYCTYKLAWNRVGDPLIMIHNGVTFEAIIRPLDPEITERVLKDIHMMDMQRSGYDEDLEENG